MKCKLVVVDSEGKHIQPFILPQNLLGLDNPVPFGVCLTVSSNLSHQSPLSDLEQEATSGVLEKIQSQSVPSYRQQQYNDFHLQLAVSKALLHLQWNAHSSIMFSTTTHGMTSVNVE
jgi:hypothetical protein